MRLTVATKYKDLILTYMSKYNREQHHYMVQQYNMRATTLHGFQQKQLQHAVQMSKTCKF